MNTTPEPSLKKSPVNRPWYELHWSTVIVILLMVGFMTIIEIHGHIKPQRLSKRVGETYQHGTPWIYLERESESAFDPHVDLDAWSFNGKPGSRTFSLFYLLLDLLLVLIVIILVGSLIEHCRRESPVALLLLTLLAACVIWWCVVYHNQRIRELKNVGHSQGEIEWDHE